LKRLKFGWLIILLCISLLMITACGGQQTQSGGENEEPVVLVFGRGADADRLDPARTTSGESVKIISNVFDGLLNFKDGSTDVEAGLAEKWDVSPDGTVYTFYLREGVKFHDGTDFNADAVLLTFQRQMDTSHQYYYDDMAYAEMTLGVIDKIEKVDDHTVKFTLKHPFGPFLRNIAMFSNAVVSPAALDEYKDDFFKNPVGTGPFIFESWEKDNQITLVANKDYWGGAPKVDKIVFKVIPENSVRVAELEAGTIDMMDGVDPNDMERIKGSSDLNLMTQPGLNINYLAFPCEKEIFDNKAVRQAINYAINKDEIVEYLYKGAGMVASGPVPKTILDYSDEGYKYDSEKAKELLAQEGYPDGLSITLWSYANPRAYNPAGARLADAIAGDLAKVGIKAEVKTQEWTSYLAQSKTQESFDGPFLLGWMGDNGDVDNFLYALLSTDNIPGGNRAKYTNADVDKLLIDAQKATDEAKRAELYKQANKLIIDDAPWVFISHTTDMVALRNNISGFVQHPLTLFFLKNTEKK